MTKYYNLSGTWNVQLDDGSEYTADLPGTLDSNSIGYEDKPVGKLYQDENYVENKALSSENVIATRFTRNHTYEGKAIFSKIWDQVLDPNKRIFLKAERARALYLKVDGKEIKADSGSLSTPYLFEVTDVLHKGSKLELTSDNSYENLPHDNIVYSSAATDETQTNWNGILGDFKVLTKDDTFIEKARVYPIRKSDGNWTFVIFSHLNSKGGFKGIISYNIKELGIEKHEEISVNKGTLCIETEIDAPVTGSLLWDEYKGTLIKFQVSIKEDLDDNGKEPLSDIYSETFGVRSFENLNGHLCLNGRRIFLRSEANCAVFPETGHPPMDVDSWLSIIKTYMGYGVNCLRFHSHCPPEAAFEAADRLGVLMQPELSQWNPVDAFSDKKAADYYEKELSEILSTYADHPSFVMLTFGNELQAKDDGLAVSKKLLDMCHEYDKTRLFAFSSNAFYGEKGADPNSDFYTAMRYKGLPMRATFDGMKGYLNSDYPDAKHDYSKTLAKIRKDFDKPVFSFEVGQFEILPDFSELKDFNGVTSPKNFELIRKNVINKGFEKDFEKRVEASGELSYLGYKEEVEAALRTEDYSGISLLGLQDFPGQGTALVGMLNSHLKPKPYNFAKPERFKKFFSDIVPLVYLDKYTYVENEILKAEVKLSNYSGKDTLGCLSVSLMSEEKNVYSSDTGKSVIARKDGLTKIGDIEIDFSSLSLDKNTSLTLKAEFGGHVNSYNIFVYTLKSQNISGFSGFYETKVLDDAAKEVLLDGGTVFWAPDPDKESIPSSIKSTFTTDFWSVGTFASQEGSMGLLIDDKHPLFKDYPTSFHTDRQWFMQSLSRALILPKGIKSIVTVMDSYAYLRNMGMLLEFKCMFGKLFISTMGLHKLCKYPECRALLKSIYTYISSDEFNPTQEITFDDLTKIINGTII